MDSINQGFQRSGTGVNIVLDFEKSLIFEFEMVISVVKYLSPLFIIAG